MLNIVNLENKLAKDKEIYLRIKVRPGASSTMVKAILQDAEQGDIIKIDVAAPAHKGKANQSLIKYLAKEFKVDKENIKIISGGGERLKLVKISS